MSVIDGWTLSIYLSISVCSHQTLHVIYLSKSLQISWLKDKTLSAVGRSRQPKILKDCIMVAVRAGIRVVNDHVTINSPLCTLLGLDGQ